MNKTSALTRAQTASATNKPADERNIRAGRRRLSRSFSLLFVTAIASFALLAACTAPTGPSGPAANKSGLFAELTATGFDLSWTGTPNGQVHGYLLQYRTDHSGWTDIPTTNTPSASFADVTVGERYHFRVRSLNAPGTNPGDFSATVTGVFVEPVLPVVRLNTDNRAPIVDKENYLPGSMTLDPNGTDVPAFSGSLTVKGRGNSTWAFPKKPYKIKLNSKASLMGMKTSKKWVLLANYLDKSQLRTDTASQISNLTDLAWTPEYHHVELILNGEYMGVYQLCESIEVETNRVNITEMEDTDNAGEEITGGYLLEIDKRYTEKGDPGFTTTKNVPVAVNEPDPPTPAQLSYIRNWVQNFENVLFSPNYKDPVNGYAKYLDVDSFIDHWIIQEATSNQDSFWSSTYFQKDRSSDKLVFGPMWDFDNSMGNPRAARHLNPTGWFARTNGPWIHRLFTDPAFVDKAAQRWSELAPQIAAVSSDITATGNALAPAIQNDELRWNYALETADTPAFLADWLTTRVNWISNTLAEDGDTDG